jgi:hypothetical protein
MPDPSGRYFFQDYKTELQARGFDGFTEADLGTYINRAYFAVARKSRWYWERVSETFTITAGQPNIDVWPLVGGKLNYFKSLREVMCITPDFRRRMQVADRNDFLNHYLSQDLTRLASRSEPTMYYEWDGSLYLLPVAQYDRAYIAYYHRVVPPLVNPTDIPITPPDMDEVILDAARARCHTRSNELSLASLAMADVEEAFDDMKDQEEDRMEEEPNRVIPDNTWL